jgi:hypothetical protein
MRSVNLDFLKVAASLWEGALCGRRAILLAVVAVLSMSISGTGAAAQGCAINWRVGKTCLPYAVQDIQDVAYDGHSFVGVGRAGLVVTSPDGHTWTQRPCHLDVDLQSVAGEEGRFVAYGMGGVSSPVVLTSTDSGLSWSVQWVNLWSKLVAAGGLFFSGNRTSSDGGTWAPLYLPNSGLATDQVAFGNGVWLAINYTGYLASTVYSSTDAQSWRVMPVPPFQAGGVLVFGGKRFVAVNGGVYSSKDGRSWARAAGPESYGPITHTGKQFALIAQGATWFSGDGRTWTKKASDLPYSGRYRKLFWTGTHLVLFEWVAQSVVAYESSDGAHWTAYPGCPYPPLRGAQVRYFSRPGLFVSTDALMTSADGETWTDPTSETSANSVAYGGGRFVVVCPQGRALWSTDGRSWNSVATGVPEDLVDVAYGAGVFVAVGNLGRIVTSPDGVTWTARSSFYYSNLTSVIYANGTFVTVGITQSAAFLSSDGTSWERVDLGPDNASSQGPVLSFVLGKIVLAGSSGLSTSVDGRTWVKNIGVDVSGNLTEWNGVVYARRYGSDLVASEDLLNWAPLPAAGSDRGYVMASDGRCLVLGGGGLLVRGTCAPYVEAVTPSAVPNDGASEVTVSGTNLSGVTKIKFGEVQATSFVVRSDNEILAQAPAGMPLSTVAVTADADDEPGLVSHEDVLRVGAEPVVVGASPSLLSTPDTYGYAVTVWGRNLAAAEQLLIEGSTAGYASSRSDDWVTFSVMPRPAGHAEVAVLFQDGSTLPIPGGFTFVNPPTITSVKVMHNPTTLVVKGTGFSQDYSATFNGQPVAIAKVKDPQNLTITGNRLDDLMNFTNVLGIVSNLGPVRSAEFSFPR